MINTDVNKLLPVYRQTWTLIEVGEPDRVMLDSATHNISDTLVLEAVEGDLVELECLGERPGVTPAPAHRWSVAGERPGEELSLLSRPGVTGLNFTSELGVNGTRVTCTSEQRNTYTQVNRVTSLSGIWWSLDCIFRS